MFMLRPYRQSRVVAFFEYFIVLLAYICIYLGIAAAELMGPAKEAEVASSDIPRILVVTTGINLIVFLGIGLLLMLIFNRLQMVQLTLQEQPLLPSAAWIAIVVLLLVVAVNGIHVFYKASGGVEQVDPIVRALQGYFKSPWVVLAAGAPVMFLAAGLPEEFMRCYVLANGFRLKSSGFVYLAVLLTSAAFAAGHYYQGTVAMVSLFVVGLVFGIFYVIRQSFWNMVFLHTIYNVVVLLLPTLGAKQP
jgi:membrane protease YdiL (CAAX protease family)